MTLALTLAWLAGLSLMGAAHLQAQYRADAAVLVVTTAEKGEGSLSTQSGTPCRLGPLASTSNPAAASPCVLSLSKETTSLQLRGRFDRGSRRQAPEGIMTWRVLDLGSLLGPTLRNESLSFSDRVKRFAITLSEFHTAHGMAPPTVEIEPAASQADVDSAQTRLGFALPPAHADLLSQLGPLSFDGDSFVVSAGALTSSWQAMLHDWGTSERTLTSRVPAVTRALYETSTMLVIEAGDGYGGLAYRPRGESACAGEGAYYWVHDDQVDRPQLLRAHDGRCRSYESAILWTFARLGFRGLDDLPPDWAVIDSSVGARLAAELTRADGRFTFRLTTRWDEFE